MESFVNNSSLISGEILGAATKALQNEEKLRCSTLRSSVTSTDLENFFKTAPKFSVVEEEEAFEEFWEQETTMQIKKLQTVLIGQNVSSSSCTVAFDEDEDKTVILEETACYDTTVEWTKEASEASSSMEEEEETKEWEDDVGDDSRKDEKKPKGQLERLGRGLFSLERLTKKERSLRAWERRYKNTTLDLGYAKDENVMKKYSKDKARYPNIYEKIKKEAEYDKDYAYDSRRHSPVHWRGFL